MPELSLNSLPKLCTCPPNSVPHTPKEQGIYGIYRRREFGASSYLNLPFNMTDEVPPPTYNAFSSDRTASGGGNVANAPPPPDYTPPSKFVIGSTITTEPLVGLPEIKGHLALLHNFAELKKQVETMTVSVPYVPTDAERKWTWFVGLAVER